MALQKTITIKGQEFNYWKILKLTTDATINQTLVLLAGYRNQEVRQEDVQNYMQESLRQFVFDGELNKEKAYKEIKKSRKKRVQISPAQYATYDEEGNELNPSVEAVFQDIETNELAGAEDELS